MPVKEVNSGSITEYPDSLVASILAASSYPSEIAEANDFLAACQNFTPEQIASDANSAEAGTNAVEEYAQHFTCSQGQHDGLFSPASGSDDDSNAIGEAVPDSFPTNDPAATEEYKKARFYFLKALSKATAEFFTKPARTRGAVVGVT